MATKKKTTSTKAIKVASLQTIAGPVSRMAPNQRFILNLLLVILVGTVIFLLAKRYRGLAIAGIVNKTPISRFELNQVLVKRYGTAVLDELINERLLLQAAKENKIQASDAEIGEEVKKLEESLGGKENLDKAMEQYGLSSTDLRHQVTLRLLQQKLADKLFSVQVTEQEVKEYFDTNKALFEGKKLEDVKDQISLDLKTQKQQQEFGKWFEEQKAKAKIANYLTK